MTNGPLSDDELFEAVGRLATSLGMPWARGSWPGFEDGKHLAETAEDLAHELAHWLVAPKKRRVRPNFGLGHPGGTGEDTLASVSDRVLDKEEAMASLVGIGLLREAGASDDNVVALLVEHSWLAMKQPGGDSIRDYAVREARSIVRSPRVKRWLKPETRHWLVSRICGWRPGSDGDDEMLSLRDVQKELNVSRLTLFRWIHGGKLPAVKVGQQWAVRREDVEEKKGDRQR